MHDPLEDARPLRFSEHRPKHHRYLGHVANEDTIVSISSTQHGNHSDHGSDSVPDIAESALSASGDQKEKWSMNTTQLINLV